MNTCEGCIYEDIHNGKTGWASSLPAPCMGCERNSFILKDNYTSDTVNPKPPVERVEEFNPQSMDAVVWAKEFMRVNPSPQRMDKDDMRGWFANAIMAGYDEARRRYEKPPVEKIIGVDLGEATCTICDKHFCTCPERQPDGSWNFLKPTVEKALREALIRRVEIELEGRCFACSNPSYTVYGVAGVIVDVLNDLREKG